MLLNIDPQRNTVTNIDGDAQIVLSLLKDGRLELQAFRLGRFNALYGDSTDAVVAEIPKLLAELRQELAELFFHFSARHGFGFHGESNRG